MCVGENKIFKLLSTVCIKLTITSAGKGVEQQELSHNASGNVQVSQPLWKTVGKVLKMLCMHILYYSSRSSRLSTHEK